MRTYDESLKIYWDNYSVIETAKHEGREQGREEGTELGASQKSVEIAWEMKKEGDSIEKIARTTGLSEKQINAL